jgi:hypothetical protein
VKKPWSDPFTQDLGSQFKLKLKYSIVMPPGVVMGGTVDGGVLGVTNVNYAANAAGAVINVDLGNLPSNIGLLEFTLNWKPTAVLAGQPFNIPAIPTTHYVIRTYGTPQNPGSFLHPFGLDSLKPTVARFNAAMAPMRDAWTAAVYKILQYYQVGKPKPQQLIYELVQRHVFNGEVSIVKELTKDNPNCWLVPKYWTTPRIQGQLPGSDCISGAAFVKNASLLYGIPGTIDNKSFTYKSLAQPTKAVEFTAEPAETMVNGVRIRYDLYTRDEIQNNFEGTVVYTYNGTTLYFLPALTQVYTNPDDILTIFGFVAKGRWGAQVMPNGQVADVWKMFQPPAQDIKNHRTKLPLSPSAA